MIRTSISRGGTHFTRPCKKTIKGANLTTISLNEFYDVTLRSDGKTGSTFKVSGAIWRKGQSKPTKIKVSGEGRTLAAAQTRAMAQARDALPDDPDDEPAKTLG